MDVNREGYVVATNHREAAREVVTKIFGEDLQPVIDSAERLRELVEEAAKDGDPGAGFTYGFFEGAAWAIEAVLKGELKLQMVEKDLE